MEEKLTPKGIIMDISDLQEQLSSLYLRLNGYFVSGFIIHAPEGEVNEKGAYRKVRGEIDALPVRFPFNKEPEREAGPSDYLHVSDEKIDILICEVKGGEQALQFNEGLRSDPNRVLSVLRWIGILNEKVIEKEIEHDIKILSTQYANRPDQFREYNIPDTNYRIRAILFAPDQQAATQPNQQRYIYGEEVMKYIWRCLRPQEKRPLSQTRYDYGLWGTYEEIVRYFKYKKCDNPRDINELYTHFKLKE